MSDQDSAASLAVQEAREECGETRSSDNQVCYQHLMKSSHRQLNQSMNLKEFSAAPSKDSNDPSANVDPDLPFSCSLCGKSFKSSAGRATHLRFCSKKIHPPVVSVSGLVNPTLMNTDGLTAKEAKPFKKKLLHWVLVRKNAELKRGVALWKRMGCTSNIEMKHRLKKAAGTILSCLKGDHNQCQYSYVCKDSIDPYCYLLPHKRPCSSLPSSIQKSIVESIWSVFNSEKLDKLIKDGRLRTTSVVEATHRTIRNPAPKGKPLRKNQTAVLQSGASVAACRGKGLATISHFQALNLPVSASQAKKLQQIDRERNQMAHHRKTARYQKLASKGRRAKFESHGRALETKEATLYRKDGFTDHNYASSLVRPGEF